MPVLFLALLTVQFNNMGSVVSALSRIDLCLQYVDTITVKTFKGSFGNYLRVCNFSHVWQREEIPSCGCIEESGVEFKYNHCVVRRQARRLSADRLRILNIQQFSLFFPLVNHGYNSRYFLFY
jgi:hypothetical protein